MMEKVILFVIFFEMDQILIDINKFWSDHKHELILDLNYSLKKYLLKSKNFLFF